MSMVEGSDFAAASTIGARERQEDDWGTHVNPPALEDGARLLALVADGMGGMPAGNQASSIAIRTFLDSYPVIREPARQRMRHALAHANREVGIAVESEPALTGMGSTLVAALFFEDRCVWLSIGDSFILHCRGGELERVNPLHIYANELDEQVRRGQITAEAAASNPDRASLTSAVHGAALEQVAQGEMRLTPGDVVILASDGIATLTEMEIASLCTGCADEGAAQIAEAIVGRIDECGRDNQDNATVVVVRQEASDDQDTHVIREGTDAERLESTAVDPTLDFHAPGGGVDDEGEAGVAVEQADQTKSAGQHGAVKAFGVSSVWRLVAAFIVGAVVGITAAWFL